MAHQRFTDVETQSAGHKPRADAPVRSGGQTNKLVLKLALAVLLLSTVVLFILAQLREQSTDSSGREANQARQAQFPSGLRVPAFEARALSGRIISFPAEFSGKIVLLDFWATWCGPCIAEIPRLVEAYERFHPQGFEILGVSLDKERRIPAKQIRRFNELQKMPWEQIYDGTESISRAYLVTGIPAAYLVDGDSGELLAMGEALRGPALHKTIEQHLRRKAERP